MFRFILTFVFLASSLTLNAQTIDPPEQPLAPQINMYLAINGNCRPSEFGFGAAKTLKQDPLFYGNLLINMGPHPSQSVPVWTTLWSFVNQDTGTFSAVVLFNDLTACLLFPGSKFLPYTGKQPWELLEERDKILQ